mmetsp:Transcript_13162/g.23869  ORF Transcript_13162/g.23869 Transcript_13162/m.23869 type:complete len:159 (-) Transcript_13162:18-494(-)
MGDEHADFTDYMSSLADAERLEEMGRQRMEAHEVWKNSTWIGFTVQTLRWLGDNPFMQAIRSSLRDQQGGTSTSALIMKNIARMSIIVIGIVAFMALGKIAQQLVGGDIVMQEEVVIIEEIPRSQAEAEGIVEGEEDIPLEEYKNRRSAREKLGKKKN